MLMYMEIFYTEVIFNFEYLCPRFYQFMCLHNCTEYAEIKNTAIFRANLLNLKFLNVICVLIKSNPQTASLAFFSCLFNFQGRFPLFYFSFDETK